MWTQFSFLVTQLNHNYPKSRRGEKWKEWPENGRVGLPGTPSTRHISPDLLRPDKKGPISCSWQCTASDSPAATWALENNACALFVSCLQVGWKEKNQNIRLGLARPRMHLQQRSGFRVSAAFMDFYFIFFIHHYYANVPAGNKCAFCETFVVTDWSIQKPWSWPHTGSKTFKQAPLSSDLWLKASAPTLSKERMEGYVLCELSASRWIGVAWNTPLAQNPRSKLMSFVITAPHSNYHSGQFMD